MLTSGQQKLRTVVIKSTFLKTASEEASMQLLRDLNPGNEVQSANQSNQEDGILQYVGEILGQEDKCRK